MSEDEQQNNRLADAREIYQGTHGLTMAQLADITSLPIRMLRAQSRAEQWAKTVKTGQTEEAVAAIARFAEWKALVAKAQAAQAKEMAAIEDAVPNLASPLIEDELHQLLERHKSEWLAPRAMSGEAVKLRNTDPDKSFTRAKLAKITAETLDIIQRSERRAWGIQDNEDSKGGVVLIERN